MPHGQPQKSILECVHLCACFLQCLDLATSPAIAARRNSKALIVVWIKLFIFHGGHL